MFLKRMVVLLLFPAAFSVCTPVNNSPAQEYTRATHTLQPGASHLQTLNASQKQSESTPGSAKQIKEEQAKEQPLSKFMKQKLVSSEQILRGLMMDDMQLVQSSAKKLLRMSRSEGWRASNDMLYLQHSIKFQNAADDLLNKAKARSMDGVSLAWIKVTMSCINCHEWVRDTALADITVPRH